MYDNLSTISPVWLFILKLKFRDERLEVLHRARYRDATVARTASTTLKNARPTGGGRGGGVARRRGGAEDDFIRNLLGDRHVCVGGARVGEHRSRSRCPNTDSSATIITTRCA